MLGTHFKSLPRSIFSPGREVSLFVECFSAIYQAAVPCNGYSSLSFKPQEGTLIPEVRRPRAVRECRYR